MVERSEIQPADLARPSDDLLEVRLRSGVKIDRTLIRWIMQERVRLCGGAPLCVLTVVPADAELDIEVMNQDHYGDNASAAGLHAVAIVAGSLMLETMARLYAAYFPPLFHFEVFHGEGEARLWLEGELATLRRAGHKA